MIIARDLSDESIRVGLWKASDRFRISYERTAQGIIYRTLRTINKRSSAAAEGAASLDDIRPRVDQAIDKSEPLVIESLDKIRGMIGVQSARRTFRSVEKTAARYSEQKDDLESRWIRAVREFLRIQGAQRVTRILATTKLKISAAINEAIQAGKSIPQIATDIVHDAALRTIDKARAMVIARTETISAMNSGAIAGAESTGLELTKDWISTRDDRTRGNPGGRYPDADFDHFSIDGQKTDLNGQFMIPGLFGFEPLSFPGDPIGSAGNVINCRCTVGFIPKT